MLKPLIKSVLLISMTIGFTRTSYGLISVQAMVGTDSTELKDIGNGSADQTFSGTSLGVAAHLDPIPLVPVGFGLGIQMPTTSASADGNDYELNGLVVDLQLTAWLPMVSKVIGITPFAKIGYIPFGAYTLKMKLPVGTQTLDATAPLKSSGTHFAVGATYSLPFIPLASALFQISMRNETLDYETFEVSGVEFKIDESVSKTSTNLLLGVEVGI
ncbi:MAG: hypothetical protein AB8G05_15460 [Oligoflexales bacterium]